MDRRQVAIETLDLNRRQLPRAALCQRRGADVAGQDIWIAMNAERLLLLWISGVIPGAGRKLDHAPPYAIGQGDAGETGAAFIE